MIVAFNHIQSHTHTDTHTHTQTHTHTHTHTRARAVEIHWKRSRLVAVVFTCATQNIHKGHTSMLLQVFRLLIPAREWLQSLLYRPRGQTDRPLYRGTGNIY